MSGEPCDPGELYRLRRDVHGFVSRYGRFFWAARQQYGQQLRVPPALGRLPTHQRPQALAHDEARRLARSRLYFLDEAATGQAVRLGAAIRAAAYLPAVRVAGHTGVAAGVNIAPPARRGLLRWRRACCSVPRRHTHTATGAEGPRGGAASDDIARLYTLFGSWLLLAVSGLAAGRRHEPTSAEITADRRAAITPSRVIYGTGRSSRQLAALVHTVIRAARTDNDERESQ